MFRFSIHSPFQRRHLWYPLAGFTLLAMLLETGGIDLWLGDYIYALGGGSWRWRDAWLTRDVIHDGGRMLVGVAALLLVSCIGLSYTRAAWGGWRRGLWYLVVASFGSGLLINLLKQVTHVDCPWDLGRYGGTRAYVPLFAPVDPSSEPGACFPAGHASAAYAWFGLYYWCLRHAPRWRWLALGTVTVLGLTFGVAQQLRGAHFVSHDAWTLGICWLFTTVLYVCWYPCDAPCKANQENCVEAVQAPRFFL